MEESNRTADLALQAGPWTAGGLGIGVEGSCKSCGAFSLRMVYQVRNVPVHSVLLMKNRETAIEFPTGNITLALCQTCAFISNVTFDPRLLEYSTTYEETQSFSPTFRAFHRRLAERVIDRYDLRRKTIIEIGCGKGEFITLVCELGDNRGFGFDPSYDPKRNASPVKERITFIQDIYSDKYASIKGDFVCCKMTLEHIQDPAGFVAMVRGAIEGQSGTVVFFQVPDVTRILREVAFWDIYYEHCSYFSPGSLVRLFRSCGFEVLDLFREYDDQYLMVEAVPCESTVGGRLALEETIEDLTRDVTEFSQKYPEMLQAWRSLLREEHARGRRVVVWGAGSKAVAFLTTIGIRDGIEFAVDINPHKHGTFLPGTGQEIVSPAFLREYRPDTVIVMNPIYRDEVRQDLARMGLLPHILTLGTRDVEG